MFSQEELAQVLKIALQNGGDFADIFIEERKGYSVGCEENKIEKITSGVDVGAGIRVIFGESTAYAYTNVLTLRGLKDVAAVVSQAVSAKKGDYAFDLKERRAVSNHKIFRLPEEVNTEDKVSMVLRANEKARSIDGKVKQVKVIYTDGNQKVTIANSNGLWVQDERVRTRFLVQSVAMDGEMIQTGYESVGGLAGFEIFQNVSPERLAEVATKRALLMLTARPAPSGKMPVVLSGEAGGTMVHEACGHGLEADHIQKELSVYAGKKGERIASEVVTVIDDGTLPNKFGSYNFDDEGTPAQSTVLIKNGILTDFMFDLYTARKEGRESTGNGRRQSYQYRPFPRMTNTFIAPGNTIPEDIIRDVPAGLYVKHMGGGQVNPINGDFVFEVAEGYLIEKGKITAPVRGATLTGNGPQVLQKVDLVGNDPGFTVGICGKEGQGVPVTSAQPTIRVQEILVGGILE